MVYETQLFDDKCERGIMFSVHLYDDWPCSTNFYFLSYNVACNWKVFICYNLQTLSFFEVSGDGRARHGSEAWIGILLIYRLPINLFMPMVCCFWYSKCWKSIWWNDWWRHCLMEWDCTSQFTISSVLADGWVTVGDVNCCWIEAQRDEWLMCRLLVDP